MNAGEFDPRASNIAIPQSFQCIAAIAEILCSVAAGPGTAMIGDEAVAAEAAVAQVEPRFGIRESC